MPKHICKTFALLFIFTAFACSRDFSSQVYSDAEVFESSQFSGLGFQSFRAGLYALTRDKGCVKCHGGSTAPYFASSNIDTAYKSATGSRISSGEKLVDFSSPASSVFIEYAGNGHCSDTPCSNPAIRAELQRLITDWSSAELASGGGSVSPLASLENITASLLVPADLPTLFMPTPRVLRFPLAQLKLPVSGLENAFLEIEMQMIGTGIYKINKPRVVGGTRRVFLAGLHVLIKAEASESVTGTEDNSYASNWHSVAAFSEALPLVDLPLYYKANPGKDYLRIGFVQLD